MRRVTARVLAVLVGLVAFPVVVLLSVAFWYSYAGIPGAIFGVVFAIGTLAWMIPRLQARFVHTRFHSRMQ
jgi:hypothetical protein